MTTVENASKILDTMLGHLGISATIEAETSGDGPCLQIHTGDQKAIIGRDGDRLEDIQYLVNRILRRHDPKAERVRVDCGHFRSMREDDMADEVREIIAKVRENGRPFQMRPLNAYYRRLVYHTVSQDEGVEATSPAGEDRLKRITISLKQP